MTRANLPTALLFLSLLAGPGACGPTVLGPAVGPAAGPRKSSGGACTPAPGVNGAAFVSQNVPQQVAVGSPFAIQVTMRNTGTSTWARFADNGFFLGSQGPMDNFTFGTNRGWMDQDACVPPGQVYTFTLGLTAPAAVGTYPMQWQVLQDAVEWFGDITQAADIAVVVPGSSGVQNAAAFVSQVVPATVGQGSSFGVQVTMTNTGDATWTLQGPGGDDGYYLGSQGPMDNLTFGTNRAFLAPDAHVTPGQSYTFTVNLTAPAAPGSYPMQWQMLQNAVAWWGQMSFLAGVTVTDTPALPPPPTRDQIGAVKLSFQGLNVTLPGYGTIPWFEPAISSLDAAGRQAVYAAKHAAGDTHLAIALSWNYSGDGGYSYPVPGRDLSGDLPAFRALVEEAIRNGFYVLAFLAGDGESRPGGGYNDPVGWTYGHAWLMQNLPAIVAALQQPADLTPYVVLLPGWDGVVPGWAPDASDPGSGTYRYPAELDNYLLKARALVPGGYLGVELASGYCHWGGGAENYTSPAGQALDVILQEFPGPPTGDQVWQIAGRELGPAYVRPPDQPAGDDPGPPAYLSHGTPRGRYFPVAYEYDEYRWVRGRVSADDVRREQAYLRSVGYPQVD